MCGLVTNNKPPNRVTDLLYNFSLLIRTNSCQTNKICGFISITVNQHDKKGEDTYLKYNADRQPKRTRRVVFSG